MARFVIQTCESSCRLSRYEGFLFLGPAKRERCTVKAPISTGYLSDNDEDNDKEVIVLGYF